VRGALIAAGGDAAHPDLRDRIVEQRDFVAGSAAAPARERHGTEVAGVIAAVAHNKLGIAGIAPGARLFAYRACRAVQAGGESALCDTFTLAQALGAAITSGARVINLSLGGPADPLLGQLTRHAIEHGAIVVGALPPDGRSDGFPLGVPGVLAVAGSAGLDAAALVAPGSDILTLEPDAHYDYASGSSLAAAHVSGAIALLLEIQPDLDGEAVRALLGRTRRGDGGIDLCAAAAALRQRGERCATPAAMP
jgi:subtilisin family serine protease